jgi:hypothetical protein
MSMIPEAAALTAVSSPGKMIAMSRTAALLSLIAALTGMPLRQAEAAADLSRSLVEVLQPPGLEVPDGGVGDDSGDATLSGSHVNSMVNPLPSADPLILPPALIVPHFKPDQAKGLWERVWWPPKPPNGRQAWLQVFLF